MGYIAHRTIVVIGHDTLGVVDAHKKAVEMFKGKLVSELIQSTVNCYESFFIAPDGSKEYWKDSDEYDEIRNEFIKWLRKQNKDFNFNVDLSHQQI